MNAEKLRIAMRDLKKALELSGVDDSGKIIAYEYNQTAKVIVIAVNMLAKLREDGDGDG